MSAGLRVRISKFQIHDKITIGFRVVPVTAPAGTNPDPNPRPAGRVSADSRVFHTRCHLYSLASFPPPYPLRSARANSAGQASTVRAPRGPGTWPGNCSAPLSGLESWLGPPGGGAGQRTQPWRWRWSPGDTAAAAHIASAPRGWGGGTRWRHHDLGPRSQPLIDGEAGRMAGNSVRLPS